MSYITPRLIKYGHASNTRSSIGHAMYNYITALLIAKKYKLSFLHTPFQADCERFEEVLGLNKMFPTIKSVRHPGYKALPLLDFGQFSGDENTFRKECLRLTREMNHRDFRTVFITTRPDRQFPGLLIKDSEYLSNVLSQAYWAVNEKSKLYDYNSTNVAIHIRRGDVTEEGNSDRWKDNYHYKNIIDKIKLKIPDAKFYIFSEGEEDDFKEFDNDVNLILNGSDIEAFNNMASADILVTGQSTFSTIISYINTGKIIYTPCLTFTLFDGFSKRFIRYDKIEDEL
jgi:hypothetical protein